MVTLPKNPQVYQTIFLMIILNLWINYYWLYFDYTKFFIVFLSCSIFDILFTRLSSNVWRFPYSWIPAGFWIAFFLRTDILILYVLAGFLAIASKHFFRINGKHFFNPSNFWVFTILVLFPQITWTNPLQWERINNFNYLYFFIFWLIILFWILIIWRVKIWLKKNLLWLILPYMLAHVLIYMLFADSWSWISFTKWYTPAFFIFTFFMLTDPQITPDDNYSKSWFAINTAILIYILQYFINENYATLASLFAMTITLPLVRYLDINIIYKKCTGGNIFYIMLFWLFLIGLLVCIQLLWPIDLVFDNRCRQLLCM